MTRWLVTGAGGMLGTDLVSMLRQQGARVTAVTRQDLDITDSAAVTAAIRADHPDVVVNCAAWTGVDLAEAQEAAALAVNGSGAANVAAGCAQVNARMIQLSTDYVFAGTARRPYPEDAEPAPASAYGRTKLAGEQAVLDGLPDSGSILRTAWLYGAHGGNFVATMIRLERERPTVAVVDDQHGQPTSTTVVGERIIAMVAGQAPAGIYHATCSGQTTWYGLAREVFRLAGADPGRVTAIPSSGLSRLAPRPGYSVLGHEGWARAGLRPLDDWQPALSREVPAMLSGHPAAAGTAKVANAENSAD
jgi:dTDP-4-dehydrorhamnose reductase